ncbi:MAG: hypothetical protein KGI70_00240 [Patescibacteria group bacterium]|nr:hypothetical protein [Patescibacteria group bacterium]
MRVRFVEKIGVPAVCAIAAATVVAYSVWASTLLHSHKLSDGQGSAVVATR